MARVLIKDIANKLGVSVSTVSNVINGKKGRVGDVLTEKIKNEAAAMNYKPNAFAKALRKGRSETIGLIISDISNPFFGELAFHVQENAEKHGYSIIFTNTNESPEKMRKMISILKDRNVDGFIIVPTNDSEEAIQQLVEEKYPIVLLDRYCKGIDTSHVVVNNYQASKAAINLLLNMKCKRIMAIGLFSDGLQTMIDRKNGCIDAMTNKGLYDPELIKDVKFNTIGDDIKKVMTDLVCSSETIDGIFFANSTTCINAMKILISLKLEIPKNIKIVCFDKSDFFQLMNASIPYIDQPIPEMGKRAVELLINHITNKDMPCVYEELQAVLKW